MDFELLLIDRLDIIRKTILKYGEENFYISFSGGKDSTVLHYLVDEALPNNKIPRVFINTGIEYKYIFDFVKQLQNQDDRFVIYNSNVKIKTMLQQKGYPFKSKEHSCKVSIFQNKGNTKAVKRYVSGFNEDGSKNTFCCPKSLKYQFEDDFNIKLSDECCKQLKKKPIKQYETHSGRYIGIVGLRMNEGGQRKNHSGCVTFIGKKLHRFKPLNPVDDDFIERYIKRNNIDLCRLYSEPFSFERTGCKGCPFALDLKKQLDIMKKYLPNEYKQCEIIWKPIYDEYRKLNYRLKNQIEFDL